MPQQLLYLSKDILSTHLLSPNRRSCKQTITTHNSRRIKPYAFVPASEQKSLQKESGDNNASNIKKQTEGIGSGGSLPFLWFSSCEGLLRITSKNRGTQERYSAFERRRETCVLCVLCAREPSERWLCHDLPVSKRGLKHCDLHYRCCWDRNLH